MNAPMVVRAGFGALRSAGPHHSGAYHPMWAHVPGLIDCLPTTPADAKGLMKTALRASDPVLMLEPKALFASKGEVPAGEFLVPFGVARIARAGSHLTIVSAGQLVHRALEAAEILSAEGTECEVIDLRTIVPMDVGTVAASVTKTHRLLIVDEGWSMCGIGAELGQAMNELAYDSLDAPVGRLHTDPISHPFAPALERAMLVNTEKIVAGAREVMDGRSPAQSHWRTDNAAPSLAAPPPIPALAASPLAKRPAVDVSASLGSRHADADEAGGPINMPFGDLTVSEGKIVRWLKNEGEQVVAGELIAEIETDKAVVEIEAPMAGCLARIEQGVGAVVPMGGRIGLIQPES